MLILENISYEELNNKLFSYNKAILYHSDMTYKILLRDFVCAF